MPAVINFAKYVIVYNSMNFVSCLEIQALFLGLSEGSGDWTWIVIGHLISIQQDWKLPEDTLSCLLQKNCCVFSAQDGFPSVARTKNVGNTSAMYILHFTFH